MTPIERLHDIEDAAQALVDAIDRNLEQRPWPFKYAVPWAEAHTLRQTLDAVALDPDIIRRIPRGSK